MTTPPVNNRKRKTCCLGVLAILLVIGVSFNFLFHSVFYRLKHAWMPGEHTLYVYTSTGDVNYDHRFSPQSSPVAVEAWMERIATVQKVKRVFWRGAQDEGVLDNCVLRPGDPVRYEHWNVWQRHLERDLHINDVAVAAAHKQGMEIDAVDTLFDFGSPAWANFTRLPYTFEDKLRIEHPEWIPIDRTGKMRQAGPLEYAYPEVRNAVSKRLITMVQKHGYDGLMLYTYFENFDTRFTDEFGFNEPIVAEFKKRYGVDIRTQDFDHAKWGELRGEYITEFLRQLHTGLKINGKQLRICLSANNPETMQEWPFNSGQVNMRIKMDWRTWLKEGVVDQVCVMGGSDDKGGEFIQRLLDAGAKPSQVCLFTERPFYQSLKKWVDRGVTIVGWSAPFATQPLERYMMDEVSEADLSSLDWKRRAQALVGLKAGTLSAETQKQLEAQAADANLLVRREAMIAIARVGTKNPKIIEDALADPESCVRTEAALAASSSMTDQMLRRLLLEVDRRPDWMFAEAVAEAINKSKLRTSPALTEMLSNPSPAVRRIAAREAKADSETTRKLLRHILSLDTDSAARYYAVATYVDSGVDFLQCLSTCMLDSDPIVSNQATVLTRQLASKLTPEEKRTLSRLLAGRFLQYDSKSKRTDKDWGWRNAVDTLLVLNDQDKKSVEDQLYSDDSVLRNYVYMGLYLPHKEHSYAPVTETEAAEITRFWAETYQASRPPSTIKF